MECAAQATHGIVPKKKQVSVVCTINIACLKSRIHHHLALHVFILIFRLLSNLQEWSHVISKTLSRLTTCVVISEEDDITTIPPSIMEDLVYPESDYTDDE